MFFFLLPVGVDYKASRWPIVTFSLMGLCVGVYLWSLVLWAMGIESYVWWMNTFWFTPSQFSVLTLFTTMFVHANLFHLLGNMVYLFLFGATTEDILGRALFLFLYIVGGVVAVLAHVLQTPEHFASDLPLGGASGAISTCMGAFFLLLPRTKIEFRFFGLFFFRPFSKEFFLSSWLVMSFWFLSDLLWAVLETSRKLESSGTAFGAHVGGFLAGMAAVGLLKIWWRFRPQRSEEEEEVKASWPPRIAVEIETTEEHPFVVYQNQQQFGPYSLEEVGRYYRDGSILPDAVFWRRGNQEWQPVSGLGAMLATH